MEAQVVEHTDRRGEGEEDQKGDGEGKRQGRVERRKNGGETGSIQSNAHVYVFLPLIEVEPLDFTTYWTNFGICVCVCVGGWVDQGHSQSFEELA